MWEWKFSIVAPDKKLGYTTLIKAVFVKLPEDAENMEQ